MVDKVLGRMEVLKGFIQIPTKSRNELIGDKLAPCAILVNGEAARVDKQGRIWSPFLKGKFYVGSHVQLTRTKEGLEIKQTQNAGKHGDFVNELGDKTKISNAASVQYAKSVKRKSRENGTTTSSFGSPGRFGHDSSKFYNSKLYEGMPLEIKEVADVENEICVEFLDKIFCKSSERMDELPENSVHLMVTSPPYNVGKEYDRGLTLNEYKELLKNVFKEVHRVLVPGGRACINVANLGRKPYIPLDAFVIQSMLDIGFLMRGEIIWDKGASAAGSTAWGSGCSASNSTLRDVHEYIIIFSKDTFKRPNPKKRKSTITKQEFLEWTKSVWSFPTESATRIGHPAPISNRVTFEAYQALHF